MKTITDLRESLFQALEGVRSGTLDLDKARAINDISKTIVETAKVEVAYINVVGEGESSFLPKQKRQPTLPSTPPGNGIGSAVQQLTGQSQS
jgi:hypothetical protein